eukprot:COSAG02_NODE_34520_length_482_cov_54.697128_1_plen_160_part_11
MKQAIDAEEFDDLEHLQQEMKEVRSTPAVKKCRVLDLSSPEFGRLTDAGFAEIAELCHDVTAVFLSANTKITGAGLNRFRKCQTGVQCIALGGQVTRGALIHLLNQYQRTKRVDLRDQHLFDAVTVTGLGEIVALCPDLEAVFTVPDSKIERKQMAKLSA